MRYSALAVVLLAILRAHVTVLPGVVLPLPALLALTVLALAAIGSWTLLRILAPAPARRRQPATVALYPACPVGWPQ